jgi:hypothetical protein
MKPVITESEMYWLTRLDAVKDVCQVFMIVAIVLSVASFIVLIISKIISLCNESYDFSAKDIKGALAIYKLFRWIFYPIFGLMLVFIMAFTFIPSTKEYAAIKVIPAIANNPELQKDLGDVYKLGVEWLKGSLKQLPPAESPHQ